MFIDLRSDTVTKPTPEMLNAMLNAEVGDDVFEEDPTVNKLQQYAAQLFNYEAALFCSSGTMANQLAVHIHCKPGDEVICDEYSHVYQYESGALAANSGVQVKLIQAQNGILTPQNIHDKINPEYDWLTRTRLVVVENTGNKRGGNYYTLQQLSDLSDFCKKNNLILHCDGARIFNACIAGGYSPNEIGKFFNSMSVCLSKGLGAPAGSLLLGSIEFIKEARRVRKRWGGGMRQIGYLAAAGLFALKNNIQRLHNDHDGAQQIANALKNLKCIKQVMPVKTNIIIAELTESYKPQQLLNVLEKQKIKAIQFGTQSIRMVTHLDVSKQQTEYVVKTLTELNMYI